MDSIYLDFAKAFDSVPYQRLIKKIESYGIQGDIRKYIEAFLSGRTQIANGAESKVSPVLSGIPQGSVLGPTLFVIYIDDLLANIKSEGLLFADDTKIFQQIKSRVDALILRSDLSLLEQWSKHWLLNFHPDKCHVLTLGKFDNIRQTYRYKINDTELEHVFKEKDLGITMDGDLSFEEHISLKVKKANAGFN